MKLLPFVEVLHLINKEKRCTQEVLKAYTCLFQACCKKKALEEGRQIHAHMKNSGIDPDLILGTTLINMYISCGSLHESRQVFEKLREPDQITWNMMILAYGKSDCPEEAFKLFIQMEQKGLRPNEVTFVGILSAATNVLDMGKGIWIHEYMIKFNIEPNVYVNNALIDMYVKCGSMHDASQVFDRMSERDVISWNTMISGWTRHSNAKKALAFFRGMISEGFKPTDITFLSLMNACASIGDLNLAKEIHFQIRWYGIIMKQSLNNTLVDMFCKCEGLKDGLECFNSLAVRDEVSWNAIIGGHCHNGQFSEVLVLFNRMMNEGSIPNEITFLSVFNVCAKLGKLSIVRMAHACVNKTMAQFNIFICTTLVDTYSKCQSLEDARTMFNKSPKDSVVLWTSMIAGYSKNNQEEQALRLFHEMCVEGIRVNEITFVNILDACTSLRRFEDGQIIHCYIVDTGFTSNICLENALIDLYAKCGALIDASCVFDSMGQHDLVSWTAMIAGYASLEQFENVFDVFEEMMEKEVEPDGVAYVTMNNACANLAVIEQGMLVHNCMVESNILMDAFVGNSLIDMYAKCGSLKDACYVLDRLYERDVISWNTMLSACAQHGQGDKLVVVIRQMEDDGITLNEISFLCILSAFGRLGLIDEGFLFFHYMLKVCIHTPTAEHYACIIDLLGRIGHVSEAQAFVERMSFQPSAIVWGALLGACKLHGFVDLGEYAAEEMLQLEPENPAILVLLSNMYAAV